MKNKIKEVHVLLGHDFVLKNEVLKSEKSDYTFTLAQAEHNPSLLEAKLEFKTPCPMELIPKVATKLGKANLRVAVSGFYMDSLGHYGQRHYFSKLDHAESIAFDIYVMMSEACNYVV